MKVKITKKEIVKALNCCRFDNEIVAKVCPAFIEVEGEIVSEEKGGPCHEGVDFHEACTFEGCVCECHKAPEKPAKIQGVMTVNISSPDAKWTITGGPFTIETTY